MPNLSEFSRRMYITADKVAEGSDALLRKVALAADQAVVSGTPVDTGRARSNWIAQIDSPVQEEIEPYVPGERGSTKAQNTQAALDQAEAIISGYKYGDEIHLANNTAYLPDLNDGSSAQAPANFIEEGVLEAVAAVLGVKVLDGGR